MIWYSCNFFCVFCIVIVIKASALCCHTFVTQATLEGRQWPTNNWTIQHSHIRAAHQSTGTDRNWIYCHKTINWKINETFDTMYGTVSQSPWYDLRGWLGVKQQLSIYKSISQNWVTFHHQLISQYLCKWRLYAKNCIGMQTGNVSEM